MSSSASDDARSELSSHEGSELSDGIAPSPRVRRASSVHTAAAHAMVGRCRTLPSPPPLPPPPPPPPLTPSARSVHYAPLSPSASVRVRPLSSARRPSSARPPPVAEAEALAGVAPHGADRLKHLQLHMEQLQQLYAQEIHKEELAVREAFVQSMCTASITLWRYVSSRGRFYTAVKALVTQYLPASNARLYQTETHNSGDKESGETGLSMVLADSRVVAVAMKTADAMGIAGHAVLAASQLSAAKWKKLQQSAAAAAAVQAIEEEQDDDGVSEASASSASSVASSAPEASTHLWLDRHADCVMPSTNDHLVLLMSLDRAYENAGFHPEIDLTIKKKELLGSAGTQLLVVVLRDSEHRPIGVVEALVSVKKPLKVDFLDAFSSLLAAALEARRSICRPVAVDGGIRIEIFSDNVKMDGEKQPQSRPQGENITAVEIEIASGTKMVVTGAGPHSINPENDMPILAAAQNAMAKLWTQAEEWKQLSAFHSQNAQAHDEFWGDVVGLLLNADDNTRSGTGREELRAAVYRLNASLDEACAMYVLFEGESLDEYAAQSSAVQGTPAVSVEAQYAALQRTIQEGKTFESAPCVFAEPVKLNGDEKANAAVLVATASPDDKSRLDARTRTLPLVMNAVQLVVSSEKTATETAEKEAAYATLEGAIQQQNQLQHESDTIRRLSQNLVKAISLDELVGVVNTYKDETGDPSLLNRVTLYVVETEDATTKREGSDPPSLRCVWTTSGDAKKAERVVLYDQQSVSSPSKAPQPRGGMAAFVLESGGPLSYSPHHDAYDPALRRKIPGHVDPTDGELLYYATPLQPQRTPGTLGVLEVAFESEDQHGAFVSSSFANELTKTITSFFQLHVWLSQREVNHARSEIEAKEMAAEKWRRWKQFVADWCDGHTFDLDKWKASTIQAIQALIPAASHVNILVGKSDEEFSMIERVKRELRESIDASSPTLNVLNHNVLRSFAVFPLAGGHEIEDKLQDTGDGLLVLCSSGDDPFHEDDRRFGAMAAGLLVVWWRSHSALGKAEASNASLQTTLDDLENQLAVANMSRRLLLRRSFHHSVESCLNRVVGSQSVSSLESVDATLQLAIQSITRECANGLLHEDDATPHTPFWVAIFELSENRDGATWKVCGGVEGGNAAAFIVGDGNLREMLQSSGVHQYAPPFPDQLMLVVQEMVGSHGEFFVQGSRVFTAPLSSTSTASDSSKRRRVLVILTGSADDQDATSNVDDEGFVKNLAQGFDRLLAWQNCCRLLHETQTELSARTRECEQVWRSLENAKATHTHWKDSWRTVMTDVLVLGRECPDEAALTALQSQLVGDIQASMQRLLTVHLEEIDAPVDGELNVKIVVDTDADNQIREWFHPRERLQLADQQSRRLYAEDDTRQQLLEVSGGTATGICIATSTLFSADDKRSEEPSITFAVRYAGGVAASKREAVDATFERVVKQYLSLVTIVRRVLDLHQSRCHADALVQSQTQSLHEKIAAIDGLESALASHSQTARAVRRLLDVLPLDAQDSPQSFASCLCRVVEELPDYRLWIHEMADGTLWSTHCDGSRHVRTVDARTWSSEQHTAIIKVAGECVALVEFTGAASSSSNGAEPLALITATLQSCFSYHHSLRVIEEQRIASEMSDRENTDRLQRDDEQTARLVRHWHHVDELLQSTLCGEQENAVNWSDVLHRLETDMTQSVDSVDDVRMVIVELNVTHRQVTAVSASLPALVADASRDSFGDVASFLGLWALEAPTRVEKRIQGDTMVQVCAHLFPKTLLTESHCIITIAVLVGLTSLSETCRCYVVTTSLVKLMASDVSASSAVTRAMDIDSQHVATAVVNWRRHEAARLRVMEAETVSATVKEELSTAQEWTEFTQRAMEECQLLMVVARKMTAAPSFTDVSEMKTRVEQFTQAVCGCEAFELFAVAPESLHSDTRERRLTPLISSLDRPSEPIETLRQLLNQESSVPVSIVRSSHGGPGCRVISLLRREDCAVGVVVLHWHSLPPPLANATLELVDSIVAPWLTTYIQLIQLSETRKTAQDADSKQIENLAEDKAALELQGLELKNHLTQIEQRNANLQHAIQHMGDVFGSVEKTVATLTGLKGAEDVWETLMKELTAMDGIEGGQLYEKTGTSAAARLVVSTLSSGDDEVLEKAIREGAGRSGLVATCFHSKAPQETRVAFQSVYKRVQCISGGDDPTKCVLVVYGSRPDGHQASAMTDRCVDVTVRLAARRVAELETIQLHAIATGALEETTQDLTMQLRRKAEELTQAQRRNDAATALHHTLIDDLVGDEIWRSLERPPQAASFPTAKLVAQWRFLQETAQRRLRLALSDDASVQLYGVGCGGRESSFIFSLPAQTSAKDPLDGSKKGFYCVALRQLQQQKREWRVMAKCIAKRSHAVADTSTKSRKQSGLEAVRRSQTVFFPIMKYPTCDSHEEQSNNEEDNTSDHADAEATVVGVLAVKTNGATGVTGSLSEDIESLVQDFSDALTSRVELIARLVTLKQQRGKPAQSQISTPTLTPAIAPAMVHQARDGEYQYERSSETAKHEGIGETTKHEVKAGAVALQWPGRSYSTTAEGGSDTYFGSSNAIATVPSSVTVMRGDTQTPIGNQREREDAEEVDSEDERQAERVQQRVHVAVASALLSFSFHVQSLGVDGDGVAALRSLVMRELKNVWTKNGDERKQSVDAELFFVVEGALRDRLDGESRTTPASTPPWIFEVAQKLRPASTESVRLWKLDAHRWVASLSASASKTQLLVAFSGPVDLNRVFDERDELTHLPSVLRILHFHITRVLQAQTQADSLARQEQTEEEKVSHLLAEAEEREEQLKRRARREEELNALTMRLKQAPDERAVIQMGLHAMKQWLQCAQVAFHAASPTAGQRHQMYKDKEDAGLAGRSDAHDGVAMETILRVPVFTGWVGESDQRDRELVGTLVARLSDTERQVLDQIHQKDGKEWLLRLLHRLADAVGSAWEQLQQRMQLEESAERLMAASTEIETIQQQVEDLQDGNDRLTARVDDLEKDVDEKQNVEERNARLQQELGHVRVGLESSEEERQAMAAKLKRYEAQLVEVNCQLEQSIRVETQFMQLEQVHAATQAREARLEKKLLKQKLQLKQLVAELTSRRDKDERDQAELVELRRQVAVLMEKQQHSGRMDATSVATAVMQAQAQVHQSQVESKQEQQQRVQSTVQRRMLRQMQLQQQSQKHKQLDLAQELKQLAAMEVREMQRRSVEQRERVVAEQWQQIRSQSPTKVLRSTDDGVAKVHSVRSQSSTVTTTTSKREAGDVAVSKLRHPSVVVAARRSSTSKGPVAPSSEVG